MDWYQKAAKNDNYSAQYNIGRLYFHGKGVSRDDKQAMDWYMKAAKNGNASAMFKIGYMYCYGIAVAKNIDTAFEWYTHAAKQRREGPASFRIFL
jgi:TPR repeat protein